MTTDAQEPDPSGPRRRGATALLLAAICLLALSARVPPIYSEPEVVQRGLGLFGDSRLYHTLGMRLCAGQGYTAPAGPHARARGLSEEPVIYRGPVYPALLALIYCTIGERVDGNDVAALRTNWDRARVVQSVLDSSLCVALFILASWVVPGTPWPGLLAALLYALCPYAIWWSRGLMRETPTMVLYTWSLVCLAAGLSRRRVGWFILAGAGHALTALCTPQLMHVLVPELLLCTLLAPRPRARVVRGAALALATFVAVMAPWSIRNAVVFRRFIPVAGGGLGPTIFTGTYESNDNWHGWNWVPDDIFANEDEKRAVHKAQDEFNSELYAGGSAVLDTDEVFMQVARRRIAEHPLEMVELWVRRLPRLWYQFYIEMYVRPEPSGDYFLFYFGLAFAALLALPAARGRMALLWFPFVYLSLMLLPMHIEPRYGLPALPALLSLTAVGLYQGARSLSGRRLAPATRPSP